MEKNRSEIFETVLNIIDIYDVLMMSYRMYQTSFRKGNVSTPKAAHCLSYTFHVRIQNTELLGMSPVENWVSI